MRPIPPAVRAHEAVADAIVDHIVASGLQPGQRLASERALAERLGVSRTTVRQAVTVLRIMGLVDVRHGDGAYVARRPDERVPPVSREALHGDPEYEHVAEARIALETATARLAALRRTDEDLDALHAAIDAMRGQVADGDCGLDGNRRFHETVARAARSPVLAALLHQLSPRVARLSRASLERPGQAALSLRNHELILQAIADADPGAAAELMAEHLRLTGAPRPATGDDGHA